MLKKYFLALSATLLTLTAYAWAPAQTGVIINPAAVDYPLTRNTLYPSRKGDPYERTFGVRRWLNPIDTRDDPDFKQTLLETQNWHKMFGGYGVIGHGEDVFTRRGAQFRRTHRGR
jgi:hypothetical protein